MTKKEYLDKLYYEIGNMKSEQKDEIISIFVEHFEQGLQDGKTEDEICMDLGSPTAVALQFLENNRDRIHVLTEPERPDKPDRPQERPEYSDRLSFTDIRIKKKFHSEGIRGVNVDMRSSGIKILPGAENEFTVTINGQTKNSRYEVYVSEGLLNIIEERKFVLMNLFNLSRPVQTDIYIPNSFYGFLNLSNKAGNVKMEDISLLHADINLTAGDIRVNKFAGRLDIHTTAGNAKLYDVQGDIDIHSAAGDIVAENCDGNVKSFSTAGNVKIINNRGYISSSTTAGNVKIIANDLIGLDASSSAGNVNVEAQRITGDTKISSSVGNVKLETKEAAASITVKTSMGNATVTLPQDAPMRILSKSVGKCRSNLQSDPESPYELVVSSSFGNVDINTSK